MENDKERFLERLKDETSTLHTAAERGGFNLELFRGKVTRELYGRYLLNKYILYTALESEMSRNSSIKEIISMDFPELKRNDLIIEDLKRILGDDWEDGHALVATNSYISRLRDISKTDPILLLAHAYNNYLADLSGGLIIRDILIKQYGFDESELHSYSFEDISDVKEFKEHYRNILSEVVIDNGLENEFIEEVKLSYIFSIASLNEILF